VGSKLLATLIKSCERDSGSGDFASGYFARWRRGGTGSSVGVGKSFKELFIRFGTIPVSEDLRLKQTDSRCSTELLTAFLQRLLLTIDVLGELVHVLVSSLCRLALLLAFEFDQS
jgi:hypothetical protein